MTANSQFFDALSDDYDVMVTFENALKNKIVFLKNFEPKEHGTALDLGCGTGADAIALSKLGLRVDAMDHSKGMLVQARINAEKHGVDINFTEASLTGLAVGTKNYDFIVSLGNTIANIPMAEVRLLISELSKNLTDGGRILLQLVNYAKLPKTGRYVLNEFENDSVSIIRRYNIHQNTIDFSIDKVDKKSQRSSQITTTLYPHSEQDFIAIAKETGLTINVYGNLKKDTYVAGASPNLVVVFTQ
ncbi:class I SAM-dependent methyltransferase [Maribacter chungangensis]|uniref:Class I SAM-dependent methyltransferase n=1 Tax=Maribacter chungangensis TaxID=1069117 RepID=A0ABW3B4U4_9FLAO